MNRETEHNMRSLEKLENGLKEFDLILTEAQRLQFLSYYDLLIEWNEKMNLTAITDYDEVLIKHFLDSLSIVRAVDPGQLSAGAFRIVDIGTGAGFPGIPIKIVFPACEVVLVDSLNKRIRFLNTVIETLGLEHITAIHGRSEELAGKPEHREQYDLVVSRAVANLSTLSEYCIPFLKKGGLFVSYKSREAERELKDADRAIRLTGGIPEQISQFMLPGTDYDRCLVSIRKKNSTPKKYPRKAGTPAKEPL